jgi:hypothetical protein
MPCGVGCSRSWDASAWTATDDRVRGGSSVSHLTVDSSGRTALFHGHLDTSTLGGAGFASQNTQGVHHWDLSSYEGLALILSAGDAAEGDEKRYVVTLKDDIPGRRDDGRMRSGVSWEADFCAPSSSKTTETTLLLPWSNFKPTYRGRPKPDAEPLDLHDVKRIGFMMRR